MKVLLMNDKTEKVIQYNFLRNLMTSAYEKVLNRINENNNPAGKPEEINNFVWSYNKRNGILTITSKGTVDGIQRRRERN